MIDLGDGWYATRRDDGSIAISKGAGLHMALHAERQMVETIERLRAELAEAIASLRRVKEARAPLGAIVSTMINDVLAKHGGA